jgi:hypothetical protein
MMVGIIAAGILSRATHTGWLVVDKYLGDALYAAMVYAALRLMWSGKRAALAAMSLMTALELFQLTLVPARMAASGSAIANVAGRLLGTQFGYGDLAAYAVGIAGLYLLDRN